MINPLRLLGRGLSYAWHELRGGLQYYDPQEQAWTPRVLEMGPTRSGVAVSEVAAMKCLDVYACIRCIAEDIAKLPLHLYEREASGKGQLRIRNHTAHLLTKQPNPEMTAFDFKCALMGHLLGWGNAFAEIEFNQDGSPRWLWPLPVDRMKVVRDPKTKTLRYEYRPNYVDQATTLEAFQVLHLKGLGFDGLVGYSPIRIAAENIGLDMAQTRFRASFFGNGGWPGMVLKHPMKLSEEAEKRLKKSYEDAFRGSDNSHRTFVLQEGMEITKMTLKPEDAQLLEGSQWSTEEIARLYRVPPHKIGHLERATNNNIEQQNIEYCTDCLDPWAARWEQECGAKLGLDSGQFFAFKFRDLLRADSAGRSAYYTAMHNGGILTTNEIRDDEGYNPMPDGDVLLVQGAMISLAAAATQKLPFSPSGAPGTPATRPPEPGSEPRPSGSGAVGANPQAQIAPQEPSGQVLKQKNALNIGKIAENHAVLLAEALHRALKIEASYAQKWAKRGNFEAEKQAFFASHQAVLRGLVRPIVHNLAVLDTRIVPFNPDQATEEICRRHIASSMQGLSPTTVESAVLGWTEARAQREARAEIENLVAQASSLQEQPA